MALTEPGGGTDILGSLRTTAVEDGDHYVLNGQKVFITAAHVADYLITIAITDPEAEDRSQSWSVFLVDANSPGVRIRKIPKLGIHACACAEIFYENVRVPKENMLGPKNGAYGFLVGGRGGGAKQTGIIQSYLVEMAIQIENARNLIYGTISRSLAGHSGVIQAQMAKIVAARASEYCAIKGMEILGGWGYTMEYDMQRHFRDYKQMVFAPISDEMAINVIARMLGLPKSY
jgi:alkylation response protein AidB-like acyl-CoA dehydrogenase